MRTIYVLVVIVPIFLVVSTMAAPLLPIRVQPSGDIVPANLLRISLEFSSALRSPILPYIALRRSNGEVIDNPFLNQELWSPNGKILTVLLHPGRVKSGLIAHNEIGQILMPGEQVSLTLNGDIVKTWKVGPKEVYGPDLKAWYLATVSAGSLEPLVVCLDKPIDGRNVGYLNVIDDRNRKISGFSKLSDGEKIWTFYPTIKWRKGVYQLLVYANLEDAAGNRLGHSFEMGSNKSSFAKINDAVIPFAVTNQLGPTYLRACDSNLH